MNQYTLDEANKIFSEKFSILTHGMRIAHENLSYDNSVAYILVYRHIGDSISVFRRIASIKDYYGENASRFHFEDIKTNIRPFPKKKLIKKVIAVVKPSCEGVAKLFSNCIDGLIVLSYKDLDALAQYAYSACCLHQNIYLEGDAGRLIARKSETDEGQWARMTMFKISDMQWDFCLPEIKYSGVAAIPYDTLEYTKKFINDNFIDVGKTIIICPVAQSSSMLEYGIWEKFADKMNKCNFSVFTNVFANEPIVRGTKPLKVSIDVVACLGTMGCKIIGVQSGLMDVLLWACPERLIVLSIIKNANDMHYAKARGAIENVNKMKNGAKYLRIEHFEEDYVLKLLMDNFH